MALTLWPTKEASRPSISSTEFHYEFAGRKLREGAIVDGAWRNQFIYDAEVVRPNCLEVGYDALRNMDYTVEIRAGSASLFVNRSDIFKVRRPYRAGDWA